MLAPAKSSRSVPKAAVPHAIKDSVVHTRKGSVSQYAAAGLTSSLARADC